MKNAYKLKYLLPLCALIFFHFFPFAKNSVPDTIQLRNLYEKIKKQYSSDILTAKINTFELIQKARVIKEKKWEATGKNLLGVIYLQTGNFDSSLVCYNDALHISEKNNYPEIRNKAIGNLGLLYSRMGNYNKAIEMLFLSLEICEKNKDSIGIAKKLADIGNTYQFLGNNKKSLAYLRQALQIFKSFKDPSGEANVLNSLGSVFNDNKDYENALNYYNQSLKIKLKIDDKKGAVNSYVNIAYLYTNINKTENALSYFFKALDLSLLVNDKENLTIIYNDIGNLYEKINNHNKAILYFIKSLELAKEINSLMMVKTSSMNLSQIYEKQGDYKKAFEYSQLYYTTKIQMSDEIINTKINEIEAKYQTEKKEIENSKLIKENEVKELKIKQTEQAKKIQLILFLGIAFLILIISAFIFYRNKQKQRTKQIKENNRQEKLRFKAVIDSEEKERIRIAKELHDGLGQLLSTAKLNLSGLEDSVSQEDEYLLGNSITIIDDAVKEVRNISHNLIPTALMNYGIIEAITELVRKINDSKQLAIVFDISQFTLLFEKETEIAIYRIVQEVLNNMIKHSKASLIHLKLSNNQKLFTLEIKDNGIGFDTSTIKNSKGIGWQNIFSRTTMLNADISVISQLGNGTEIKITMSV